MHIWESKMNLFQTGNFELHAGGTSNFKIDCDALTDDDWDTLALIAHKGFNFKKVEGIPTGGEKFAAALQKYVKSDGYFTLIVDDVYTTGLSMRKALSESNDKGEPSIGLVVFTRSVPAHNVEAMFNMINFGS